MGAEDKWGMWGFFWLFVMARLTISRRMATISTANDSDWSLRHISSRTPATCKFYLFIYIYTLLTSIYTPLALRMAAATQKRGDVTIIIIMTTTYRDNHIILDSLIVAESTSSIYLFFNYSNMIYVLKKIVKLSQISGLVCLASKK